MWVGTNAPGQTTNFTFSLNTGATNLALVVSNNASAYSHLLLARGRTPTDTDFDFIARVNGQTNQIVLEAPEFRATNYGLAVRTPGASALQSLKVLLSTNRPDLRSGSYPVLKPLAFTATGMLSNSLTSNAWNYFQVDVPTNLTGWRVVLSGVGGNPNLYVRRGALPTTSSYDKVSLGQPVDTIIFDNTEATTNTYFIGVVLPSGPATNTLYTLTTEVGWLNVLAWDPGVADGGTQVYANPSQSGGDYYFRINAQTTASGAWRTVLQVASGEADLYLRQGGRAETNVSTYSSIRIGSDGVVLAQGYHFNPGQDWYLTVHATPGAQWSLHSGEAYIQPLPALATNGSSGAVATIGPEALRFFKTTITPSTLAWRIGLNGLANQTLVHKTRAPLNLGGAGGGYYDWAGAGQLLIVPPYLNIGDQYFVSVAGAPGQVINFDSRQQVVTDLNFNAETNFTATGYGYTTFRVQVPVQQIAWQVNVTPISGDANVAVRRDNVPNDAVNDAFSELPGSVGDSVTMVPPILSDATFYITVYGATPYTCNLTNGQPIITDVHYVFQITNDAPARAGWRFYRVVNTAEQLGTYGWDLELSNQVAGSEIALRRNAVPSRWNYRNCSSTCASSTARTYVDYYGDNGYLQRPGHQADVWYIGVYQPNVALGPFVLTGQELTGVPMAFDNGAGSTTTINSQPAGKWQYFIIQVPTNILGWDLRLTNVTSGDPRLVVCQSRLPTGLTTASDTGGGWYYPWNATTWSPGYQWAASSDWTGYTRNADGFDNSGKLLQMGFGNPLQAGTYYVGVLSSGSTTNVLSYTLVSRGIGATVAIPVADLAFTGGIAGTNALPTREASYYRIVVPANAPSLKLRLTPTNGEVLLALQKDYLPNVYCGGSSPTTVSGGRLLQKRGNEEYLLLPQSGQSNIVAGTYYLAVVSEGAYPNYSDRVGPGATGYTLSSLGAAPTNQLGSLDKTGLTDLITNDFLQGGESKFYQFSVPVGTLAMEVRLENPTAYPRMSLRADPQLPTPYGSAYGWDFGQARQWYDDTLINIATPAATTYTLTVFADTYTGGYSNTACQIRVHALTASNLAFDGGVANVTAHSNNTWRYFLVNVPANALGWDLRLTNPVGLPKLVVCRDLAPESLSTITYSGSGWYYPWSYTNWPSSNQWAAAYDWTDWYYDANGTNRYGQILQMGLGNPLEPGSYYVGVFGTGTATNSMSYSLVSRGIGPGLTIPVQDLPFTGGVVSSNGLPPRECAYYRVSVPPNQASWKLRLTADIGESMLMVYRNYLPNVDAGSSSPVTLNGGRALQKPGNEQFLLLPRTSPLEYTITNGTYYLAVAGEGMNPSGNRIGTNTSAYKLYSYGPAPTNQMGPVDATGLTDLTANDALEGGEAKFYSFSVPYGTLSLEVHLDNVTAAPYMTLRADSDLPRPLDSYGVSDGHTYTWSDSALINLTSPTPTNYTLCVQARNYVSGYSNAAYTVRIHALGLTPVPFDRGTAVVTGQPLNTWRFFTVTVPGSALGWDLRLTNVTSGNPQMVIARDLLPDALSTHTANGGGWYYPWNSTNWPSGSQWAPGYDWTSWYFESSGSNSYGRVFETGMGNPLEAGTYYVGVINSGGAGPLNYTVASRGIGLDRSIPVGNLAFVGSTALSSLVPREAAYYRITVPPNQPNWKLHLENTLGESMFALQKDYLPNISASTGYPFDVAGGRELQKAGNENYLLLPKPGQTNLPGGTYYLAVISEGMNPSGNRIGSNACGFTFTSYGPLLYTNLGTVGAVDLVESNYLEGAETKIYQFAVPAGTPALEVRLEDRVDANVPYMRLRADGRAPSGQYSDGGNGGENSTWAGNALFTLPNVVTGLYTLNLQAYPANDATYTLRVRQMPVDALGFDPSVSRELSSCASGTLSDQQHQYYQVVVPALFHGQPLLGWKLDLYPTQGTPRMRVRPGSLPDDASTYSGTSPWNQTEAVFVTTYLTPGNWYVDVQGQGSTAYMICSSGLLLERPAWAMPQVGGTVTTPGLPPAGPLFGDSGVDAGGTPLPLDQGVDLEQGRFHYYAVSVPSNNVGVLRTRLDAISGNPDLFIRVGNPPTLSHNSAGNPGTSYERYLNANVGSEYGNWVPFDGRTEWQLAPGLYYIAVQAAGNANVRYRLRASVGDITPLAFDGLPIINQTLAGGDWRYYRVCLPTNCPTTWNVNFAETLGDVVMYVRDTTPPGQGGYVTDYRDWADDTKNHGPYPSVDPPGVTNFNCPPLRPGHTYYLGFRAVNDATFTVSGTTNATAINWTNVVPFYNGTVSNLVPAYGVWKLRIDVPPEARRLYLASTSANSVTFYLDQGSLPTPAAAHHSWSGTAVPTYQFYSSSWPWFPGYMYFLLVTNTSAVAQPVVVNADGRNSATDDFDKDGLPDAWELTYWPNIYSYNGTQDSDGDAVNNLNEYLEGTNPTDPNDYHPRLTLSASYGVVTRNPVQPWYILGQHVQLTASPNLGYGFVGWSGNASGIANPYDLVMDSHKTVTGNFAVTNDSGADYLFQFNLKSSVGSPPDLLNYAAGNIYTNDTVDGCARTALAFQAHSGLRLTPTAGVIPSDNYTIVMLFRFDLTNGYRRVLDFKTATTDLGLYVVNGRLSLYSLAQGPASSVASGQYVQVVLTRDSATGVACGYVNGVQQFSVADPTGIAVISAPNELRFFKDDGSEDSSGAVARIRLYSLVMPPAQIAALDRVPGCAVPTPGFLNPPGFGVGVHPPIILSITNLVPGVIYHLQAAGNLTTNAAGWNDINVFTPGSSTLILQDPDVWQYDRRFYRISKP